MPRSTGRSTGLRNTRSPAKMRVMKPPTGRVMTMIMALNSAIWIQPMGVMAMPSEPFRAQQREQQVAEDANGDDAAEDVIEDHGLRSPSQPVAQEDVAKAQGEAPDAKSQEENVEHSNDLAG